jgi:methyl-accepting chemotaxis protein
MKLSLRARLMLMLAVPLLGMLWVSAWNTVEKMMLASEMQRLQGLVSVATRVGALVHELQKERGMSAGFIGSKGANFAAELPKQREAADLQKKELLAALGAFDAAHFGAPFVGLLNSGKQQLDGLGEKRQAVTALSIPGPEAIGYYTKTIAALLAVPAQLAALSPDKDIARLASSYTALLQAKERAGIERATLSNVFGADKFLPEMLVRFVRNAAEQDTWFGIFEQYASPAHAQFAAEKLKGAAVEEVTATKKTALARMNEPSLGLDAKQWFAASTARIDLLLSVEQRLAGDMTVAMQGLETFSSRLAMFYALATLLAAALVLYIGQVMVRRILAQMGGEPETAMAVAHAVADGNLDNRIELQPGDDSSLLSSMKRMQGQLLERLTEERRIAAENLRIRIALDNVSTGVMIADNARNIIYVNKAVEATLRGAQDAIRQQLPSFDANRLLGSNIDAFHKNPAHQAKMLAEVTQTYTAHLRVGGRHLTVSANPVIDPSGQRLGAVAEWRDNTQEVNAQAELKNLLDAAVQGDFSKRIAEEDKEGFFRDMAQGMNQLMDTVAQALNDLARVLNAVAHNDLTQRIDANYSGTLEQLKNDANGTVDQLRAVVGQIKEATEAIDTAAKEIAAGNADLSARTEEQASNLEETASSTEQINSTVKNNAENARVAAELAKNSNSSAEKGGLMVGRVVETMSGIQTSSQKIGDIIGVINSIAFQTNILALNAAVEAARAGEQGRGFAVVATEVRNLAQRSADAAREIKTLIDESVGKVEGGVRLVHETGETITEVVDAFKQLATLVGGIAEASLEQAEGIEQVSNAVSQMDEVTQQNAALVEQAAAAAESLEEQARSLTQAVAKFRLDANQAAAVTVAPANRGVTPTLRTAVAVPAKQSTAAAMRLPPPHLDDAGDEWAEF